MRPHFAVSMFDLFAASSSKSQNHHGRSKCSSLENNSRSSVYSSDALPKVPLGPAATIKQRSSNGNSLSLIEDDLATPCRAHQRSFEVERERSTRHELPPLITPSVIQDHPDLNTPPVLPPILDHFQFSPTQSRQASPAKVGAKLADWFNGESDPITFSILPSPTKELSDPLDTMSKPSASRTSLIQQGSSQAISRPPMSGRFSLFTTKVQLPKTQPPAVDLNDKLLDLDVHEALFPAGPADPFSPAAFKNLVQNAEGLLSRLQAAYKERTQSLHEMIAEKDTQAEELEGAETRAQHLKMQLDGMAVKLAEQDDAMMNLVDDLAREKLLRREEEEARKRSVLLVKASQAAHTERSQRESRSSINSDWSCESGEESSVESLFSQRQGATSPTLSMSSVSTTNSPDAYRNLDSTSPLGQVVQHRPGPFRRPISKDVMRRHDRDHTAAWQEEVQNLECANCHGVANNEAWNVVGVLNEENKALKGRVEEMEGALDGCLDAVNILR